MLRSTKLCDDDDQKISSPPPRRYDSNSDDDIGHLYGTKEVNKKSERSDANDADLQKLQGAELKDDSQPAFPQQHGSIITPSKQIYESNKVEMIKRQHQVEKHQVEVKGRFDEREGVVTRNHDDDQGDSHENNTPGAMRERGYGAASSHSTSENVPSVNDAVIVVPPDGAIDAAVVTIMSPLEATVVVNHEEDIEGQVAERFRQRADEIADQVVERLRQNVVEASNVIPTKEGSEESDTSSRRRLFRMAGCFIATVAVLAAIIVVVVVVVRNNTASSSSSSNSPTQPPVVITSPPSTVHPTIQPTTMPPAAQARVSDLQSNQSETVMQLINGASNHTILANFLHQEFLSDVVEDLSVNNVTLIAPSDESFRTLQSSPPFTYYFSDSYGSWWHVHLTVLLGSHVLTKPLSTRQIFGALTLPTIFPSLTLDVDVANSTIENGTRIVVADVQASNGYIQVPNHVMIVQPLRNVVHDKIMLQDQFVFSGEITKFRTLLERSGLHRTMLESFPWGLAVFAPNDEAFDALNPNISQRLFSSSNDTSFARDLILYHMFDGNVHNFGAPTEFAYHMLNDITAWFTTNDPQNDTFINDAKLLNTYVAMDGILYIIDRVLVPPNIGEMMRVTSSFTTGYNFTSFYDVVQGPAQLGNLFRGEDLPGHTNIGITPGKVSVTVFAPVEHSFAQVVVNSTLFDRWLQPAWLLHLQNVISHHFTLDTFVEVVGHHELTMLSGFKTNVQVLTIGSDYGFSEKTIDGINVELVPYSLSSVMTADNGLVYVIDGVLLPPWVNSSIYEELAQDSDFSTLLSLIQTSLLVTKFLKGADGPVTLLAPNNAAFAAMNNTLDTSNSTLVLDLLNRHIVGGNWYLSIHNSSVFNWNNQTLRFKTAGNNTYYLGSALVLRSNWLASNGVVHVIDRVLTA